MAREVLDLVSNERTTIMAPKILMDSISIHLASKDEDNFTNFTIRALLNQLEREGVLDVRSRLEELNENSIKRSL